MSKHSILTACVSRMKALGVKGKLRDDAADRSAARLATGPDRGNVRYWSARFRRETEICRGRSSSRVPIDLGSKPLLLNVPAVSEGV